MWLKLCKVNHEIAQENKQYFIIFQRNCLHINYIITMDVAKILVENKDYILTPEYS